MNLLHTLRTLLNIRKKRQMLPAGTKPQIGSNLVLNHFRIRLKFPLDDEQWEWLTMMGWRRIDMRTNRRRYHALSDATLRKLLDRTERDQAHEKILFQEERAARK